jgi:hypothetical protein
VRQTVIWRTVVVREGPQGSGAVSGAGGHVHDPTADVGASPPSGGPDYVAFLFSVSIRSLAPGPDDAGFWPVISWPSATV